MKRGSIELARHLCVEIAGPADEDDDTGRDYGSVDVAEILSAEVERLRAVIDASPHHEDCRRSKDCGMLLYGERICGLHPGSIAHDLGHPSKTAHRFEPSECTCWKRLARLRGQD